MPFATNPSDGIRSYYEDEEGSSPPVLFYAGFAEPLGSARDSGLALALRDRFRLVFADHRGHGRSDKPHGAGSYALPKRVGDVTAILDELGVERAHFIGISWGARLGFAVGKYASDRLLSLTLLGNQPYAWDMDSPIGRAVSDAVAAAVDKGMDAFIEIFESSLDYTFPEPLRTWTLENDPLALDAAVRSARTEGDISRDLGRWNVPCLICAGADDEMHDQAEKAASEIPSARFLSLPGHTHLSAPDEVGQLLPQVLDLLESVTPET